MNTVARLQLGYAVEFASKGNFFYWAQLVVQAAASLTAGEQKKLAKYGAALATYLSTGRDRDKWRPYRGKDERIDWLRRNPVPVELVETACLRPGVFALHGMNEKTTPLGFLRTKGGFTEEKLESAGQWLADAVDCLESYALLSVPLQRAWRELGRAALTADTPVQLLGCLTTAKSDEPLETTLFPEKDVAETCRDLTTAEGRRLAAWALELLDGGTLAGRAIAEEVLEQLACLVPDALHGGHVRLAQHRVLGGHLGVLYRGANAAARDILLAMEDNAENYDGLLKALAWIGDAPVQRQFARWRRSRSQKWKGRIFVKPHEYCYEAGWELTQADRRRQLYFDESYRLIPAASAPADTPPGPVQIATPRTDVCGHCGNPMTNLFDLDLRDRRLRFLGLKGTRLRIASCTTCWPSGFSRFDTDGTASWSPESEASSIGPDEFYPLTEGKLVLGPRNRTPVEGLIFGSRRDTRSYIGGHAKWLNDAWYPRCSGCKQPMMFVGQLDMDDLGGNGNAYSFLCRACRFAATTYDCT